MRIYFYQAECGDAARISFEDELGNSRNIFIDSGYERTYRNILRDEINAMSNKGESIDLWILTHDHDDHIGGVIKYIRDINAGFIRNIVNDWGFVLLNKTEAMELPKVDISSAVSIRQGNFIKSFINNEAYSTPCALQEKFIGNIKFTFLSPIASSIDAISKLYDKENDGAISKPMGVITNDYNQKLMEFDLSHHDKDTSILNLSSIAFIAEWNNKKILWLSDSHAESIVNSLNILGYSEQDRLSCDIVKMSHHGSDSNCSDELFSLLNCGNYVISANGDNQYALPNKKCIARLLRNKNRGDQHYNLYFTYSNDTIKSLFENEDTNIFEKLNFTLNFPIDEESYLKLNLDNVPD